MREWIRLAVLLACCVTAVEDLHGHAGPEIVVAVEGGQVFVQDDTGEDVVVQVEALPPAVRPQIEVQLRVQLQPAPQQPAAAPQAIRAAAAAAAKAQVEDGNADPQAAVRARQRQEQAKQFEGLLQPMLRAELELARKSCGSLVPKARAEVLAAGRATVKEIALELATRQMNGRMGTFDARQRLRDAVRTALTPHATTAEIAAYDREEVLRETRRADVARVQIIAKVDDELELSDAQRKAIEEHLTRSWDTAWIRELNDTGNMVNNRRIAPDYAEQAIVPHLDASQRDEWKAWCQVAGFRMLGTFHNWHWYSQGLTQADPWWGQWTP